MHRKPRKNIFAVVLLRLVYQMCKTSMKNPKDLDVRSHSEFGSSFIALRINLFLYCVPFVTVPCIPLQGDNQ